MTILKTFFRQTDRLTWIGIILALMILVYGWTARFLHIYFFWESAWYGWTVFLVSLILLLAKRIRYKKSNKQKASLETGCLIASVFFLASQLSLLIIFNQSDAFAKAKKHFLQNKSYEQDLGPIKGFAVSPAGYMNCNWGTGGNWGHAEINVVIKGEKKYRVVTVILIYADGSEWEVTEVHDPCGYCWIKDLIRSMFLDNSD